MKANIHPKFYQATINCSGCNASFEAGSTVQSIRIDICSNCHPFFTGQKKLIDTEGRVERFERRASQGTIKVEPKKAKPQPVFTTTNAKAVEPIVADKKTSDRPKSLREMLQDAANKG